MEGAIEAAGPSTRLRKSTTVTEKNSSAALASWPIQAINS